MTESLILHRVENNIGYITLNRHAALNALNMTMIDLLTEILIAWRHDPNIAQVVIGSPGRAFCAGGDLKMAYEAINRHDLDFAREFFTKEYALNAVIHHYPKPYIAILNGITMGAGMGISIHGSQRIVTQNSLLCMPETSIGFFPDVGGTYFLNQCPGFLGMFLGLTSYRLDAADAIFSRLATHYYMPSAQLGAVLSLQSYPIGGGYLEQNFDEINQHFSQPSLSDIITSLRHTQTPFTQQTLTQLAALSPSSLEITFTLLTNARNLTFDQALAAELAMSQQRLHHPDFKEGIRAAVIDKDRQPVWQ